MFEGTLIAYDLQPLSTATRKGSGLQDYTTQCIEINKNTEVIYKGKIKYDQLSRLSYILCCG